MTNPSQKKIKTSQDDKPEEGKHIKFVDNVDHLSFSSRKAIGRKQEVLYITERAVFKLQNGELTLTEVAPGINLQDDILKKMPFQPAISDKLGQMGDGIFQALQRKDSLAV